MNLQIALILGQDGFTNGAIYALLALSILLVFAVTRILLIPQGEFVAIGALTMGAMQAGEPIRLAWLMLGFTLVEAALDLIAAWQRSRGVGGRLRVSPWVPARIVYAVIVAALALKLPFAQMPMAVQVLMTLLIAVPLGPQTYRLFYQPLAGSSSLVLLIVSVAVHFAYVGIALLVFGAGGAKTVPFTDGVVTLGTLNLRHQTLWVFGVSLVLIVALALFFNRTLYGKALRATAINRTGARLMGISPSFAGRITFLLATLIGVLSGVLIAPITTLYYDSGFLISLKGFVGAIIGGLASYPMAAVGALIVGLIESFSAFWASTYKEIIVFTLIIPFLLWRSLSEHGIDDDHDDGAALESVVKPARAWHLPAWSGLVLFVGLLAIGPFVLPPFYVTLMNYIGLYAMVALGLVLLTGVAGLTSFGQAAFVGVGAYAVAMLFALGSEAVLAEGLLDGLPWLKPWAPWLSAHSAWLGLALGLALTTVVAFCLGWLTLKLSGHYLPLGTIAWGIGLYYYFGTLQWLGAYNGVAGLPPVRIGSWVFDTAESSYLLIWTVLLLAILAVRSLLDSREGRAMHALKGGRVMAEAMGIDTARSRRIVFMIAALLACLSGWMYATMQRFINPTPFGINFGIEYLFMAVVGGAGHVWGAVVGAGIITVLKQWLQDLLPRLLGQNGQFEMIVFGLLMVLVLQKAPGGLWPLIARWLPFAPAPRRVDPAAEPLPRRDRPPVGSVVLQAEGITRRFGGLVANNAISLTVKAGEILALIGPNGAGKSTLLQHALRRGYPTSGRCAFLMASRWPGKPRARSPRWA
jgi:branched-chain amino acid transport system ATP-binding protein